MSVGSDSTVNAAAIEVREIPSAWTAIAFSRTLSSWESIPDELLPIPPEFIAIKAYHLFVRRHRLHGHDIEQWLEAERKLRQFFRLCVRLLLQEQQDLYGDSSSAAHDSDHHSTKIFKEEPEILGQRRESQQGASGRVPTGKHPHGGGKIGDMERRQKLDRIAQLKNSLSSRGGHEPFTQAERQRFKGKMLAVLCSSGEVIAAGDTEADLKRKVDTSPYAGSRWRVMSGIVGDLKTGHLEGGFEEES